MNKKDYQRPTMCVIKLRQQAMLLSASSSTMSGAKLGNSWTNSGGDGWGDSSSSGSSMGGWTDDGDSAWE